ncbi:2-hydroxyacid dehydrogenase [Thermovenabulum gondwanense]|uniref:Hydroxypyruvate reductase n=1 Tax=Thermovenabulum gondwanense TaxID=520767 RepID=A0A162MQ10_9FIRM|nr:2-hydroxyacid dehydrogenase [Thermovenabulum gondwanense]KYO66913.1 Hydroxypyruvate reductase [Thermovenabulum gondwanense]
MVAKINTLLLGDAMIPGKDFETALKKYLSSYVDKVYVGNWEENWDNLQKRRLAVEKNGPEIEEVDPLIIEHGKEISMLLGLFVPVSKKAMDFMPNLKIIGVSRAGVENVNVEEATKKGILVFNVEGRNAEAVSDFAIGMILAECRNIARAHYAIKNGMWRKEFPNSDWIPELKGKTVGIIGFGYIGRLVAKKLSGFDVERLVYDPYVNEEDIYAADCIPADKETIFKKSDFITLHARLTQENKNFIGEKELSLMKPTAYIINTARAGLINQEALINALKTKKIAGAALDVFWEEPLPSDSELLKLDNVTLTSHLAGTTKEALTRSPELLAEDILRFFQGNKARFIVNPSVLEIPEFKAWLEGVVK